MPSRSVPCIALVGLMGAGKSAVGALLAERLALPFVDLDREVEQRSAMTVSAIFERLGEPDFRRREAEALEGALGSGPAVIACGGGTVLHADSRDRLKRRCRTVWLDVSPAEALRRIAEGAAARPLLAGADPEVALAEILKQRRTHYADVAWLRLETQGKRPDEVAAAIAHALELWP